MRISMPKLKALPLALALLVAPLGAWALTADELRVMIERREAVTVIDIRGKSAYEEGHIPGAINVPSDILQEKRLPPFGRVVVCGDSIDSASVLKAVELLNQKTGISAEGLSGGYDSWTARGFSDTRPAGLAEEKHKRQGIESLEKTVLKNGDYVVVDIRLGEENGKGPQTELGTVFPKAQVVRSGETRTMARSSGASGTSYFEKLLTLGKNEGKVLVLVDDGDGRSEELARKLKAAGVGRVVILAGGELGLSKK